MLPQAGVGHGQARIAEEGLAGIEVTGGDAASGLGQQQKLADARGA
jgi:hypothetical protein